MAGFIRISTLAFAIALSAPAMAESAVDLSGGYGLLNAPAKVRASVILLPGGNGYLGINADGTFSNLAGNQLVRTRKAYNGSGIATLTLDSGVSIASAVTFLREKYKRPVIVVATSRGTLKASDAVSARVDGLVLTAGFLGDVQSSIGSAETLPPTLVIHHRKDECRYTSPSMVEPFKTWGGTRVRVTWLDGGQNEGDPCQARGYHGFAGLDGQVVGAASRFALSVR